MKTTQWIIVAVSFMLVFANIRMFGASYNNAFVQSYIEQLERECDGKNECFKKAEVTRQFLAMLQDQHKIRLERTQNFMNRNRKFTGKRYLARVAPYLNTVDKMQSMVQKYVDYLKQRDERAQREAQLLAQSEPQIIERIVEKIVEIPVEKIIKIPVEKVVEVPIEKIVEVPQKQDESIAIALCEITQKINDLYAQREQDQYMQKIADRERFAEEKERLLEERERISSDRLAMQMHQQQMMQPQPQMYMPQQQFVAHSMGMPMQQNNYQQQMAMQLQSQAMAIQQQASMLMMQAQQSQHYMQPMMTQNYMQPIPIRLQQSLCQPEVLSGQLEKKHEKRNSANSIECARKERVAHKHSMGDKNLHNQIAVLDDMGIYQLMKLIDFELRIVNGLLKSEPAHMIQDLVKQRDTLLDSTSRPIVEIYNAVLDLATQLDGAMEPAFYDYMVNKNGKYITKTTRTEKTHKKSFLSSMMYALERYYLLLDNMQATVKTANR